MNFECIPAIDLRGGRVVRLLNGDYSRETAYGDDPLELAIAYADQGARWLHLVDLDAARTGGFGLHALVRRIRSHTTLQVQAGGGLRSEHDVLELLDAGANRAVVGTLAVREPARICDWLREFGPEAICVALDARRDAAGHWRLPVAGWTEQGEATLEPVLDQLAAGGLRHLLCTDIDRDGTLGGPNVALYHRLAQAYPQLRLIASGGVASLTDVAVLRAAGVGAAVLGRALLEGRFRLDEALAC